MGVVTPTVCYATIEVWSSVAKCSLTYIYIIIYLLLFTFLLQFFTLLFIYYYLTYIYHYSVGVVTSVAKCSLTIPLFHTNIRIIRRI